MRPPIGRLTDRHYAAAARIAFWQYHFTAPDTADASGAWWRRDEFASTQPIAGRSSN